MSQPYVPGAIYTDQIQINTDDQTIRDLNIGNTSQYKSFEEHLFPSNDLYISKYRVGRIVGIELPKDHVKLKVIMDGTNHVQSFTLCINIAKRTRLVDDRIITYAFNSRNKMLQAQNSY